MSSPPTKAQSPGNRLLSLPLEIRLQIHAHVAAAEAQDRTGTTWSHTNFTTTTPTPLSAAKPSAPMWDCQQLRREYLQVYFQQQSFRIPLFFRLDAKNDREAEMHEGFACYLPPAPPIDPNETAWLESLGEQVCFRRIEFAIVEINVRNPFGWSAMLNLHYLPGGKQCKIDHEMSFGWWTDDVVSEVNFRMDKAALASDEALRKCSAGLQSDSGLSWEDVTKVIAALDASQGDGGMSRHL